MKRQRKVHTSGAGIVLLALAFSGTAAAQNLVVNGSFEEALATGWTTSGEGCVWDRLQEGETTGGFGEYTAPPPTDGDFVLLSDTELPTTCTIQQDIQLAAGAEYTLTADAGYNYGFASPFPDPDENCSATLAVTGTDGTPIATVFSAAGDTSEALASRPEVDLSDQAGETVRLIGTVESCAAGPAGIVLDNLVLSALEAPPPPGPGPETSPTAIPSLNTWGIVLLAALLGFLGIRLQTGRQRNH